MKALVWALCAVACCVAACTQTSEVDRIVDGVAAIARSDGEIDEASITTLLGVTAQRYDRKIVRGGFQRYDAKERGAVLGGLTIDTSLSTEHGRRHSQEVSVWFDAACVSAERVRERVGIPFEDNMDLVTVHRVGGDLSLRNMKSGIRFDLTSGENELAWVIMRDPAEGCSTVLNVKKVWPRGPR